MVDRTVVASVEVIGCEMSFSVVVLSASVLVVYIKVVANENVWVVLFCSIVGCVFEDVVELLNWGFE